MTSINKKVSLSRLIDYIVSFADVSVDIKNENDVIFKNSTTTKNTLKFELLKCGTTKNINDFPEKLKKIFDPFIKECNRCGTTQTVSTSKNENEINLSLYYSILFCLLPEFRKFNEKQQAAYVTKLRDKLIIYASSDDIFKKNNYEELEWSKKDVIKMLTQYKSNKVVIKLMADYFNLNIFILNINEDRLYVMSSNDSYDLFRSTIFLSYYEENFEIIGYQNYFILNNESEPIKKLINVDKKIILLLSSSLKQTNNLTFNVKFDDLTKYLPEKKDDSDQIIMTQEEDTENDQENDYGEIYPTDTEKSMFTTNDVVQASNKIVFKISTKTKLDELQAIAKKLGIQIEKEDNKTGKKKQKTRNELITEIDSNK